jgi:hypothetical protein
VGDAGIIEPWKNETHGGWFRIALSIEWLFVFWCGRKLHTREALMNLWAKLHSSCTRFYSTGGLSFQNGMDFQGYDTVI